ncbi:TetR/AcrR family transcriptional regulator [Nocardia elegans]|uniref:TetR/AcrR family transcriptional regulator n=1 Tax=Nocardia elegans TaxID=300029 RepID=A0ABW6TPS9_9NOCA
MPPPAPARSRRVVGDSDRVAEDDGGSERQYAGMPPEVRRQQRRERLLEATLDLVGTGGVASLTVGAVCARAGLSKRYFYESFTTTDELVAAALERSLECVLDAVDPVNVTADTSVEDMVRAAVSGLLRAMDDPRAARLYLESPAVPAAAAARDATVEATVDQLLQHIVGDSRATEPQARLTAHLLISGSTHVIALWLRGDLHMDREEFIDTLVRVGAQGADQLNEPPHRRDEAPMTTESPAPGGCSA